MIKYICNQCGAEFPKWMGKCTSCDSWNALEEFQVNNKKNSHDNIKLNYTKLGDIHSSEIERLTTGFKEFDRVLGGGIVKGEVILLSGDPGIGKSTLLLQSIVNVGRSGKKVLYATGEESENQISLRANRLFKDKKLFSNINLVSSNNVDAILQLANTLNIDLLVIDSIQTMETTNIVGVSGGVAQVKESSSLISRNAKLNNISTIIVGHVNKDGAIAGPKVLEHIVDTVIYLEGDRFQEFRILRSVKNRYGAQGEIGIFEMVEEGLKEVDNPSSIFVNYLTRDASGVSLSSIIEGSRPIIIEVQSLCVPSYPGNARRVANGVDYNKFQLLIGVISKILNYKLLNFDLYLNIVGGLKVNDPSVDLAICASIISSYLSKPISQEILFIGEVGLAGEIRPTSNFAKRITEAETMGVKDVVLSSSSKAVTNKVKIKLKKVSNIKDILSTF